MKKILFINSVCGTGSTGRICTDLAEAAESAGFECKIAYGRGQVPEKYKKYAVKIGTDFDVKIHALKARIFDCSGFASLAATKKFIKWMQEFDPDIIHLHNIHGYYINIEMLFEYLASANKRVIWTLHDCWSFTGHCANFDYVGCNKWQSTCKNCVQTKEYPKSYADHSKFNFEKKKKLFTSVKNILIITPSEWHANLVRHSFFKKYPVEVIYNGIDITKFKPTNSNLREKYNIQNKRIILGVANIWGSRKGLDDLIELSKSLNEEYKIIIVGNILKNQLPKNILHIERTDSQKELAEIYTMADVFVNPTKEEVFGLVNIEALACGTPVISNNVGVCHEIINNDVGMLYNKGNFLDTINTYFKNEKKISSEACRRQANLFSKNKMINAYLNTYQKGNE